jgi:hypothetical protein
MLFLIDCPFVGQIYSYRLIISDRDVDRIFTTRTADNWRQCICLSERVVHGLSETDMFRLVLCSD